MALRNRILQTFEDTIEAGEAERQALLNFVIVGGGPTGVELAGAMAEMKQHIASQGLPGSGLSPGLRSICWKARPIPSTR